MEGILTALAIAIGSSLSAGMAPPPAIDAPQIAAQSLPPIPEGQREVVCVIINGALPTCHYR